MPTYNDFTTNPLECIDVKESVNNMPIQTNCIGLLVSSDVKITGIQQPTKETAIIWLKNCSTTNSIILVYASKESELDNQIKNKTQQDFILKPQQVVSLFWDADGWWICTN